MRVKCLAQEHNTMTEPELEPGPLVLECGALTIRPPCLPQMAKYCSSKRAVLPQNITRVKNKNLQIPRKPLKKFKIAPSMLVISRED